MTRTFFENGGMEVQYNIVSGDTMRAAQKDPDSYRDLVVRVAGYSAYFIELAAELQNDLIARTGKHAGLIRSAAESWGSNTVYLIPFVY
jgi:pyruvate-formate lyase